MKNFIEKHKKDFWKISMKLVVFWTMGATMLLSWHLLHGPWIWPIQAILTGVAFVAISRYDWDSDDKNE